MNEWLLIIMLNIMGGPGEIRDVSSQLLGGFTSKQTCDAAASSISERYISLVGRARDQQGIAANSSKSAPRVWYECIQIKK